MSEYSDMTRGDRTEPWEEVKPADRRSGSERRLAVSTQTPPTGDGTVVLDEVLNNIAEMAALKYIDRDKAHMLREDLKARAEMGRKKYGTMLRVNNGRKALVDLYQEVLDALMYAMQGSLESDDFAGIFIGALTTLATQIAGELDRRG